ncbi:MAG: hypothetical protein ACK5HO_06210 [Pseudomonadota bacterium]
MTEVTTQAVVGKIVEAQTLLTDYTTQAVATRLDSGAANQSSKLSNEEMAYRVAVAIAALKGEVPPIREQSQLTAEQLTQKLATFVETFKIRAIEGEPSQVAQTIPTDKTYADYLREGQALSIALHAAFPAKYKADQAIWPARLEKLLDDPAFQAKGTGLETITDGCVSGTNGEGMTRKGATQELAKQGLQHENDPVLVAAHTGRYLVDATSIFQGQAVRAAGGAFYFHVDGLRASVIDYGHSPNRVSSSARRAPSELKT